MEKYFASIVATIENTYTCYVLDFPEAISEGKTLENAVEMAEEILVTCAEEYVRERRELPNPSTLDEIKLKTQNLIERNKEYIDTTSSPFFQLLKLPNMEAKPVKIMVSFPKNALEEIDKRAEKLGMTRSGYLVNSALSFQH